MKQIINHIQVGDVKPQETILTTTDNEDYLVIDMKEHYLKYNDKRNDIK